MRLPPLKQFDIVTITLSQGPERLQDDAFFRLGFAALGDLAADLAEPDLDRARQILAAAAARIDRLAQRRRPGDTRFAVWRRDVALSPARTGRALRLDAIRSAEAQLRALGEGDGNAAAVGYHSSSVSQ